MLDATKLGPKLYQGSYPRDVIRRRGIDVLVLCAEELQHRAEEPGLIVLRCPLRDDGSAFTQREWNRAVRTSDAVVDLLLRRKRVLVTCAQGRNRSGLVSGIVLYRLTTLSGEQIVRYIQDRRPGALTNDDFAAALFSLPPKRQAEFADTRYRALHRAGPAHQFIW